MPSNPIDIISAAIRDAGCAYPDSGRAAAEVAANALTDPAIVEVAMHAIYSEGLHRLLDARILDGPDGGAEALQRFALAVLWSVAGEA